MRAGRIAMTPTRTWTGWAVAVVAAASLAGCTSSSPVTQPVQPPGSSTTTTAHRVDTDHIVRQLDVFFANDAATTNAFRNRRALLVTVDGQPILERYWHSSATTTGNIASVTKTVIGTLIGIALDEGKLRTVDQTLGQLLPSYSRAMNRQVAAITLRQLLTMTSGLPAEDDAYLERVFLTKQDWVRAILAHGITGQPGQFQYSNAGSHLLSVILSQATGRSVLDYAREKLFDPLGITSRPAAEPVAVPENIDVYQRAGFAWPTDPQGRHTGDSFLKLTARDMAKLGQLWLQDGRWSNRQLVPARWIKAARTDRVPINAPGNEAYGYQVWLGTSDGHDAITARGAGGQLIEMVPDLGLVVAVLSHQNPRNPDPGIAESDAYVSLVANFIAPAIR
jgi:CubicO group peptidase (beta-lactamase class C family)